MTDAPLETMSRTIEPIDTDLDYFDDTLTAKDLVTRLLDDARAYPDEADLEQRLPRALGA